MDYEQRIIARLPIEDQSYLRNIKKLHQQLIDKRISTADYYETLPFQIQNIEEDLKFQLTILEAINTFYEKDHLEKPNILSFYKTLSLDPNIYKTFLENIFFVKVLFPTFDQISKQ